MLRVGLTGGIACGKTVVRKLLADRGAFTVDADEIAHRLLAAETELARQITEAFGTDIRAADGSVDRKKLGAIVFSDSSARLKLNELVHPRVIAEERRLLDAAERKGVEVAVVDAALMVEAGTYRDYRRLVVVHCPRGLQLERLMARGLSGDEAAGRIDSQLPIEEKLRYADYLVDTSGNLKDTERQVGEVWKKLHREASQ